MGTDYYFSRDGNRTGYFVGKTYALARHLERQGPIVVTPSDARDLAETLEIAGLEDGCSDAQVAPTGRDANGTSLYLLALAFDIARWSDGMPITLVSAEGFADWQDGRGR